jgi:hypothetical protein
MDICSDSTDRPTSSDGDESSAMRTSQNVRDVFDRRSSVRAIQTELFLLELSLK